MTATSPAATGAHPRSEGPDRQRAWSSVLSQMSRSHDNKQTHRYSKGPGERGSRRVDRRKTPEERGSRRPGQGLGKEAVDKVADALTGHDEKEKRT